MNTLAGLLALTLASLTLAAGCAAAPDTGDKDYSTPSKAKKDSNDDDGAGLPNKAKSDTNTPAPAETPAPAATPSTPATPPPTTPAPTTPAVDPLACANLGQCCDQLTNTYGRLACLGVQLKGNPETCSKSLIACRATIGLGGIGGGGGAGACDDDNDCPGAQICVNNTCR